MNTPSSPAVPANESLADKLARTAPYVSPQVDETAFNAYWANVREMETAYRTDLEAEYGTGRFPAAVRDALFAEAWRRGHANGYEDVTAVYGQLLDLVEIAYTSGLAAGIAARAARPTRNVAP